jgi:hypothetical protein
MKCPICKEDMDERHLSEVEWGQTEVLNGEDWFSMLEDNITKTFYECFECEIIKEKKE